MQNEGDSFLTALEAWGRAAFQRPGVSEVTNKQVARVEQPTTRSGSEPAAGVRRGHGSPAPSAGLHYA